MKYRVSQFVRNRWHVVNDDTGCPIYDGAPYGKDKPVIFKDEDEARECAARLNSEQST